LAVHPVRHSAPAHHGHHSRVRRQNAHGRARLDAGAHRLFRGTRQKTILQCVVRGVRSLLWQELSTGARSLHDGGDACQCQWRRVLLQPFGILLRAVRVTALRQRSQAYGPGEAQHWEQRGDGAARSKFVHRGEELWQWEHARRGVVGQMDSPGALLSPALPAWATLRRAHAGV